MRGNVFQYSRLWLKVGEGNYAVNVFFYIQLCSIIFSSFHGRPFCVLFYVCICIPLNFVTGYKMCEIPLTHSYSLTWWWSTAKEQVQNSSLMIFTHNSIYVNGFSSAQPFLTYLLEDCCMLHNNCVNYCHSHFAVCFCAVCFTCLLKFTFTFWWTEESVVHFW